MRKTKDTKLEITRDFDESAKKWKNAYTIKLLCDGKAVANKELEFWYVERYKPGYDARKEHKLEERMKMGGTLKKIQTGNDGIARISLPEFDTVENIHLSYKFVVRFNMNRRYPEYKPVQSPQFEFYAMHYQDPPLD